jgi:hypothetical protein
LQELLEPMCDDISDEQAPSRAIANICLGLNERDRAFISMWCLSCCCAAIRATPLCVRALALANWRGA